jgi:hypothetical protein
MARKQMASQVLEKARFEKLESLTEIVDSPWLLIVSGTEPGSGTFHGLWSLSLMRARGTHGDAGMKEPRKSPPSKPQSKPEDKLDEELEESFPASDPPANTPTAADGPERSPERPEFDKPPQRG